MSKVEDVKIIRHFKDSVNGDIHGIYECKIAGEQHTIIRNGDDAGAICFWIGEPVTNCIARVRKDVKQELFEILEDKLKGVVYDRE